MTPLRTVVYIDGFNLYYGSMRGTPYRWLNLLSLCNYYLQADKNQIVRIKYFTALVKPRASDPDQHIRQQTYLRALQTIPEIEIIYGHFLSHVIPMPLADGSSFAKVRKTEEKKSDVNIAVHMLNDGYQDRYDLAVLISNDSDLSEVLRVIRDDVKKLTGVLNPQKKPSQELGKYSLFQKQIRKGALQQSLFPDQLSDENGIITKPTSW